jgi:hypothetical protein
MALHTSLQLRPRRPVQPPPAQERNPHRKPTLQGQRVSPLVSQHRDPEQGGAKVQAAAALPCQVQQWLETQEQVKAYDQMARPRSRGRPGMQNHMRQQHTVRRAPLRRPHAASAIAADIFGPALHAIHCSARLDASSMHVCAMMIRLLS